MKKDLFVILFLIRHSLAATLAHAHAMPPARAINIHIFYEAVRVFPVFPFYHITPDFSQRVPYRIKFYCYAALFIWRNGYGHTLRPIAV